MKTIKTRNHGELYIMKTDLFLKNDCLEIITTEDGKQYEVREHLYQADLKFALPLPEYCSICDNTILLSEAELDSGICEECEVEDKPKVSQAMIQAAAQLEVFTARDLATQLGCMYEGKWTALDASATEAIIEMLVCEDYIKPHQGITGPCYVATAKAYATIDPNQSVDEGATWR